MQPTNVDPPFFQIGSPIPGPSLLERLRHLLDDALDHVASGECGEACRLLGAPLTALWSRAEVLGVQDIFTTAARDHALFDLLQQDPYTRRAFEKPRGYPGDAVMLDYALDMTPPPGTSPIGRQCFHATTHGPMALSVRYRRAVLRAHIDQVVARIGNFRILSVACGHCRELDGSLLAEAPAGAGEFVAFDPDPASCAQLRRARAGLPLRVWQAPLRCLMTRQPDPGAFDLVYAAGLLDHLPGGIAARLLSNLACMLRPGGRLVVANFVPDCDGRGYMHTMMDWRAHCRGETELRRLFPRPLGERVHTWLDPHRNIAYGELHLPGR